MLHAIELALSQSDFFRGLPPESCRSLASVSGLQTFRKRAVLFMEETRGEFMFLLLEGKVQLHKESEEGQEIVVRTVQPGEVFAEVILFEQNRYPVTATALTRVKVLALPRHAVLRLLDGPEFRKAFIVMLMNKQRYLAERLRYLAAYDVEERFFMFLREHYGEATEIAVDLSKKALAAAIGATPETFSRLIKRLKCSGRLRWKDRTLRLSPGFWTKWTADVFH